MNSSQHDVVNTSPLDMPLKQDRTEIMVVGHKDFSIDSFIQLVQSYSANCRFSGVEPGENWTFDLSTTTTDILLIQNEIIDNLPENFIHSVLNQNANIHILVFGKNMSDERLYQIVCAGADGYINEHMSGEHIGHALTAVSNNQKWIERRIMERFIVNQQKLGNALEAQFYEQIKQLCNSLTRRETEVLCKVVKGLPIKQMAEEVYLSQQGVKIHLSKLFKKFNVKTRNQLILAAFDAMSPAKNLSYLLQNGLEKELLGTE